MQLRADKKAWGSDDQTWLGSVTGTDDARTVTIDGTKIAAFSGFIPSGIPLKEGEGGKYEPVDAASDELAGFLLTPQVLDGEGDVIAPMMWHGAVRADRLPEGAFDVSTLTAGNPRFEIRKDA